MGKRHIPRHMRNKAKRANAATAALAVCFVLLVILIGAAIGRYQRQFKSDGSVKALDFYFTSNLLDGGTHTLAAGSQQVEFTLGNHADELRYSEVDIAYVVTVTPADDGTVVDNVKVGYSNASQKLNLGAKQDDTVTITDLEPGTYTVKAEGIGSNQEGVGGYKTILTATIVVPEPESVVYKYLDTTNSEYVLLTVWSQGYQGTVTITPPASLIPDNTDRVMETVKTGEAITDEISFRDSGYCSHTYRFFGSGVTAEDFTITYNNGQTATVKAPN